MGIVVGTRIFCYFFGLYKVEIHELAAPRPPPTNVVLKFQCESKVRNGRERAGCDARVVGRCMLARVAACAVATNLLLAGGQFVRNQHWSGGRGDKHSKVIQNGPLLSLC